MLIDFFFALVTLAPTVSPLQNILVTSLPFWRKFKFALEDVWYVHCLLIQYFSVFNFFTTRTQGCGGSGNRTFFSVFVKNSGSWKLKVEIERLPVSNQLPLRLMNWKNFQGGRNSKKKAGCWNKSRKWEAYTRINEGRSWLQNLKRKVEAEAASNSYCISAYPATFIWRWIFRWPMLTMQNGHENHSMGNVNFLVYEEHKMALIRYQSFVKFNQLWNYANLLWFIKIIFLRREERPTHQNNWFFPSSHLFFNMILPFSKWKKKITK